MPIQHDASMPPQTRSASTRRAAAIALGLACTWLLLLLAGADHPPPPRFVSVLPVLLVAALLVYWRAAGYARWRSQRRPWRVGRVIGEGALAGVALGGILAALPGPDQACLSRGPLSCSGWR